VYMTRGFNFTPGEFYHVYNRGVDKRDIYMDEDDKRRFQKLLYLCNGILPTNLRELPKGELFGIDVGAKLVEIGAYCLMTNHFHILIKEIREGGISTFMLRLGTAHSMYINAKYKRKGSLFEGPFQARHALTDRYLKYLFAYIHLNACDLFPYINRKDTRSMIAVLQAYPFASFTDHLNFVRPENLILKLANFPAYFSSTTEIINEMNDWLTFDAHKG